MKNSKRLISLLAALCIALGCLVGCQKAPAADPAGVSDPTNPAAQGNGEFIDYVAQVNLDMNSETKKQEVTVKTFVDGDTTHFHVSTTVAPTGVLKARYLAVNTPESTGKIEEWGKKASNFTKEKLSGADSIYIESDDSNWNLDSTGGRHLVWVWYRTKGTDTYRNLNIELLQEGLSVASKSAETRYGDTCMKAIGQAKAFEKHVHSKLEDPDFFYGAAMPITLPALRANIEQYKDQKVAFEGVITYADGQTVYVEEYDPETDLYFGMTVYYGYNLAGKGLQILEVGNRILVVGSVQYYETAGTWQVSDIQYVDMRPNDPANIQLISSGHEASNRNTDPAFFTKGTTDMLVIGEDGEEVIQTFKNAQLMLSASLSMDNLVVTDIYTTKNEESASKGAMTLTCKKDGVTISVRTVVLKDAEGNLITADAYQNKTIDVRGIVDVYDGKYQIKVFSPDDIIVH